MLLLQNVKQLPGISLSYQNQITTIHDERVTHYLLKVMGKELPWDSIHESDLYMRKPLGKSLMILMVRRGGITFSQG
jgi:hypothetical protein